MGIGDSDQIVLGCIGSLKEPGVGLFRSLQIE